MCIPIAIVTARHRVRTTDVLVYDVGPSVRPGTLVIKEGHCLMVERPPRLAHTPGRVQTWTFWSDLNATVSLRKEIPTDRASHVANRKWWQP
jgi:hypothetical protein